MDEIRVALLKGLQSSGTNKTFVEILSEAKVQFTGNEVIEAANSLESLGLIKAFKLPVEIRGKLTSDGIEFLNNHI